MPNMENPSSSPSGPSLPTVIRSPPVLDTYTPLAEHQSRTPVSFFDGPPVLHYHGVGAKAYVNRSQQTKLPWGQVDALVAPVDPDGPVMGDGLVAHTVDVFVASDTLTLYAPAAGCGISLPYPVIALHAIKSAYTADGRRVPTIYMQLEMANGSAGDEDEPETVELTLVPAEEPSPTVRPSRQHGADATAAAAALAIPTTQPPPSTPANSTPANSTPANNTPTRSTTPTPQSPPYVPPATRLFEAVSACADLHPDRFGDDDDDDGGAYPSFFQENGNGGDNGEWEDGGEGDEDEDGILFENGNLEPVEGFRGVFHERPAASNSAATSTTRTDLPPPMPGSSGWITAENAHEFFDEEGNWRGRSGNGPLGEGAGRVRGRDETETAAEGEDAAAAPNGGGAAPTTAESSNGIQGANGDGTESKRLRTE